jgi:hypothetical protein
MYSTLRKVRLLKRRSSTIFYMVFTSQLAIRCFFILSLISFMHFTMLETELSESFKMGSFVYFRENLEDGKSLRS